MSLAEYPALAVVKGNSCSCCGAVVSSEEHVNTLCTDDVSVSIVSVYSFFFAIKFYNTLFFMSQLEHRQYFGSWAECNIIRIN